MLAEILREPNSDLVAWLLGTLMQICNGKEQAGQKGNTKGAVGGKRSSRKCAVGAKPCAQGDKKLKDKPDANWNKGSGDLKARPHPVKLPACEKELEESMNNKGSHQQQKDYANAGKERPRFHPQQAEELGNTVLNLQSRMVQERD